MIYYQILFILINYICFSLSKNSCGYDSCNQVKEGYLNVHLIPHSHDDVGWLKTVDQYYYGSKNNIQHAGVQYILDTVVRALDEDSNRRFTFVEMAYFSRWWTGQNLKIQQLVKNLVNSGRLQFALGGWCMADEATVHYADAINQMTLGRNYLKELFGSCGIPLVAWQIDPFGHSRDHADLFQDSGYDAVFFQRIDYREKNIRKKNKSLEIIWNTNINLNQKNGNPGLFTGIFYNSYCSPDFFCFDTNCNDEPIKDDPDLEEFNVNQKVHSFINFIKDISKFFQTNQIMILMGCDFTYENAFINFKNIDKLIAYANLKQINNGKVNLIYSTPACYTKAVNKEFLKMKTMPSRKGDFFPYASRLNSYWTGYFTSRSSLKYYAREASIFLNFCEHVSIKKFII